jgi:hypothetical protein
VALRKSKAKETAPTAKEVETEKTPIKSKWYKQPKKLLGLLVVLVLLAGAGFFAVQYKHTRDEVTRLSNPQEAAKEEVKQLTTKVGNLVAIPNETPTLATVNDPAKLKDQTFFARAEKGDKVLIFTQAKRAILYRPSSNKVIESAPVNIGDSNTQQQSESTAPATQTPPTQ